MSPLCGGGKLPSKPLHRGTADAEMKVPSVESPELRQVLPLKPGVGQNIEYSHACFAHFWNNFYLPAPFSFIYSRTSP